MQQKNPEIVYQRLSKLGYKTVYYKLGKQFSKEMLPRLQKESLRFLALCATQEKQMTPSTIIDEWWHAMILCTKQYGTEVKKACGRFIHHMPNQKKSDQIRMRKNFWNTIQAYERYWGEPDLKIWGIEKINKKKEETQ